MGGGSWDTGVRPLSQVPGQGSDTSVPTAFPHTVYAYSNTAVTKQRYLSRNL